MSDKQPEPLRLAEILDEDYDEGDLIVRDAAAELRRLHALCEEMGEALQPLIWLVDGNARHLSGGPLMEKAKAAIDKWKESK